MCSAALNARSLFNRCYIWDWKANFNGPALKCVSSLVMTFLLGWDFRHKVCFAVVPGSCPWDEMEQVHGCTACLIKMLDVQGGAVGCQGPSGSWGSKLSLSSCRYWWAVQKMKTDFSQRTRVNGDSLWHGKFWLDIRGNKIPKKVIKHWYRLSREVVAFHPWRFSDLDGTRSWANWSSGICAGRKAGLDDLQRFLPT